RRRAKPRAQSPEPSAGSRKREARSRKHKPESRREPMPLEHAPRCTHTKITGHLCKSPALKGKNFCYFHQRVYRHVAIPYDSTIEPQFILDNEESIQYAIMETL